MPIFCGHLTPAVGTQWSSAEVSILRVEIFRYALNWKDGSLYLIDKLNVIFVC